MFLLEGGFGIAASSSALIADSVDMLGDSLVYVLSFLAVGKSIQEKSNVAMTNGIIEICLGLGVLIDALSKAFRPVVPNHEVMSWLGFIALAANAFCAYLLLKYRDSDINMKAVWICTRNDAIGNFATIAAGFAVLFFASKWPDIIVGSGLALFIIWSSIKVIREAQKSKRNFIAA